MALEIRSAPADLRWEPANEMPARLEVPAIPDDFEPERTEVEIELPPAPSPVADRPAPALDRALPPARAAERLPSPEPSARVEAETAATEIHNPPPAYPPLARRHALEGAVVVEILILADGTCGEAKVVENAGPVAFAEAALEAVRKWKYRPALRGDRAVASTQRVRFVFKLKA